MSIGRQSSARTLADTIARENGLLRALDLAGVARMLPDKTAALEIFEHDAAQGVRPGPATAPLLRALVTENRTLLERALSVQEQVVALVSGAIAAARGPQTRTPLYGPDGASRDLWPDRPAPSLSGRY
jgi:hypothetical protein